MLVFLISVCGAFIFISKTITENTQKSTFIIVSLCSLTLGVMSSLFAALMNDGAWFNNIAIIVIGAFSGLSFGCMFTFWVHTVFYFPRNSVFLATGAFAVSVAISIVFCADIPLVSAGIIAALSALVSSISLIQAFMSKTPPKKDSHAPTKLLLINLKAIEKRSFLSFVLIGLSGMFTIIVFFTSTFAEVRIPVFLGPSLGVLALLVSVLFGRIVNKEMDFFASFKYLVIISLVTFFPFDPGTAHNLAVVRIFSSSWIIFVIGYAIFTQFEVNELLVTHQRRSRNTCIIGLICGTATALVLSYLLFSTPIRDNFSLLPPGGVSFVTTLGASTIVITFLSSNVILNQELIRKAKLVARGRFSTMLYYPERIGDEIDKTNENETDTNLDIQCRNIALEKGLTPRELEVFNILSKGHNLAKVQELLIISKGTAITHRQNLYRKLDVHSRQELIDYVQGQSDRLD